MSETIRVNSERKAEFSLPFDFPIRVYETDLAVKPHGFNAWHWHDELQLCIVRKGSISMTVQEKTFLLHPGDGIFINEGLLHTTHSGGSGHAVYSCVNIHPGFLNFFHGSVLEQKYLFPFLNGSRLSSVLLDRQVPWQSEILSLAEELIQFMITMEYGYELEVYCRILLLWKNLVLHAGHGTEAENSFRYQELKEILTFIHSHYMDDFSLDEIAGYAHRSKSSCCRLFKQAFRCTIWEYLTEYRIQKSLPLLLDPAGNVTEAAYAVGFSSVSYYIKRFNEILHMTPGAYKNMVTNA